MHTAVHLIMPVHFIMTVTAHSLLHTRVRIIMSAHVIQLPHTIVCLIVTVHIIMTVHVALIHNTQCVAVCCIRRAGLSATAYTTSVHHSANRHGSALHRDIELDHHTAHLSAHYRDSAYHHDSAQHHNSRIHNTQGGFLRDSTRNLCTVQYSAHHHNVAHHHDRVHISMTLFIIITLHIHSLIITLHIHNAQGGFQRNSICSLVTQQCSSSYTRCTCGCTHSC